MEASRYASERLDKAMSLDQLILSGFQFAFVISGTQKVAVAAGFMHIAWPIKIVHAKILVLGLDSAAGSR